MAMNPMAGMGRPPAMGGMPPSMGVAPMGQAPTAQGNSGIMPSVQSIKTLTETLRYMPEAELHQYAAMHRNDPFVFPLAFQVSQARQQMRAGQAAQMAGQKTPSVVDQDLAQMAPQTLPEDQGIGALNAPNLQNMADGGIAGYADGGQQPGMFNYAQMAPAVDLHPNSGVTPRNMADGGIAHFADTGVVTSAPLSLADVAAELKQADAQLALAVKSGDPQAVQTYTQARDAVRNKLEQTAAKLNVAKVAAPVAPAAPAAAFRVSSSQRNGQVNARPA